MIDTNRPVPAAIDGRRWAVDASPGDLAGATDTRKARLFAPVSDSPTARMVRNHELAHARITPAMAAATLCKRYGVSMEALQWCEDSRISEFLDARRLVDADAITPEEADAVASICRTSERAVAGAFMVNGSLGSQRERLREAFVRAGVDPMALESIEERVDEIRDAARTIARDGGTFGGRRRVRRGRRIGWDRIFASRDGFRLWTIPAAKQFDLAFPAGGDGDTHKRRGSDPAIERELRSIKGRGAWGVLTDVHRPKLDRAVRPRRYPGRRFSDCGVIPSAVHRLPTDGAVFAAKRPVKGGTVLCDASGSMHYHDDDIERILQEAPGSTIAFYAGADRGAPRGRIVIGAERGRAATVAEIRGALPGQENLIDAPALRWLARQPAPRFWVSDEGVGGVTDFGRGGPCHDECLAICRAAGIRIVRRIELLKR